MSIARQLAEFLTETKATDLPDQAMEHAAMIVASTFASAAFGTTIQSAQIVRAMARENGGKPEASVWFDGGDRLPVAAAVQANAVLSDAAASDDSDLRAIVHAGTPATAAALAFAERLGRSGEETLAAMVLGYEAAGRISEAITPQFKDRGFHGCLGATFASAVTAARLLRLNTDQMAHTIALTATSIGGLATAADTSVSREWHAGLAAHHGGNAALAAGRGYTGELTVLEAKKGFFEAFGGIDGATAGAAALKDLGQTWDIVTDMAIKLVPGGHPYHAIGEAAGNAAREGNLKPAEIAAIVIHRPGMTALSGPRFPKDLIDMAHSPVYFAAAGAADHGFSWVHASPEKISDPVIHDLIAKVSLVVEPVQNAGRYRQGASVTIRTHDGRHFSSTVFLPKGSGALGIAWSDIDAKCHTLMPAAGLGAPAIDACLAIAHGLRGEAGVSRLIASIRP